VRSAGERVRGGRFRIRPTTIALLCIASVAAYLLVHRDNLSEYIAYLTEDRKPVELSFGELSEDWTEEQVKVRFAAVPVQCYANPDPSMVLGDRVCSVGVKANNGVPTFLMSFFFSSGRLSSASYVIPWWAHRQGRNSIVAAYGRPAAAQLLPWAGVRLVGWQLPGGAALFYNRDRPINPLEWNSMFWNSASACAKRGCFTP
jgi:hypothetical protein